MNPNSISFSLGDKRVNLDKKEVCSFLENIKKAGKKAIEKGKSKSITAFVSEKLMGSKSEIEITADVMRELKEKISLFKDKDLTKLFEETLQIVSKLSKQEPDQEALPYIGPLYNAEIKYHCETLFKESDPGTYVVCLNRENYNDVWVIVKREENEDKKLLIYSLVSKENKAEGYTIPKKVSEGIIVKHFHSISEFIKDIKEKGYLKKPLSQKDLYNFEKVVKQQLANQPYFEEMDAKRAIELIGDSRRDPGTYLIIDKKKDREAKVIVYKDSKGEIQKFTLTPHFGVFRGYDCEGKWYSDLNSFLWNKEIGSLLKEHFKFSLEEVEARQQIASFRKILEMPIAPLERKEEEFRSFRKRLASKEPLDQLLKEAFRDGKFEVAKWLAIKAGSLEGLDQNAISKERKAQLLWLEKFLENPEPSPKTLDNYALEVGYGYKSSNLMIQQRLVAKLNEKLVSSQAEVPPFLPFSDFEIRQHMQPILQELEALWDKFIKTFDEQDVLRTQKEGYDPEISSIMVKPDGRVLLENIHTQVVKFFIEYPFESLELQDWIEKHAPDFLIIRSTGKEDTEENPNPGGNETIAYVEPKALAISKAIGEVVASYFGIKSITQRLMVGDKSLFKEPPFLPVLVMSMVTEKINGEEVEDDVTRSGVMFTRQKGKAEGVTLLQVGFGNNEGIVSSKVSVDTHYIDDKQHIMSVVRDKKTRYVPLKEAGSDSVRIGPMNNSLKLQRLQALPDAIIKDMKTAADFFAEVYGKNGKTASMDLEYTVKLNGKRGKKPVISLLQIRPLVEKQEINPSYLDLSGLDKIPQESKISVKTLLGGDSSVQNIAASSDAMFVDNLTQGLTRYLRKSYATVKTGKPEKSENREILLPKVIFTRKMAHLTSHEAIFFRKRGVVVYVVDNAEELQKIKQMVSQATVQYPLKADPQRGLLVETKGVLFSDKLEVQGYISYPIPREITVPKGLFTPVKGGFLLKEVFIKFETLNKRYRSLDAKLRKDFPYMMDKRLRELFDIVASSADEQEAKLALATILRRLSGDLNQTMKTISGASKDLVITLLQLFDAATSLSEEQILPALAKKPGDPNRLFALKFLDALVFQELQPAVSHCSSWIQVKSSEKTEGQMEEMAKKFSLPIEKGKIPEQRLQMQKLAIVGFNEKTRKNWTVFVNEISKEKDPEKMKKAATLVAEIVKMNLGSEWLNLIFNPLWKSTSKGPDRTLEVLKGLFDAQENDRETLNWTKGQMEKLEVLRVQIGEWSSPEYVKKNLLSLRELYLKEFRFFEKGEKPVLVELYKKSNTLGKLAILEFYRQAVEVYDQTIKSTVASTEYPKDCWQKVQDFSRLLIGYHRMLKGAFQLISKDEEKELMHHEWENQDPTFQEILNGLEHGREITDESTIGLIGQMEKISNKTADPEKLLTARAEFNVEPLIIGSHVDLSYGVLWPDSLEEIFTAIHQNLEKVRMFSLKKQGLSKDVLEGDAEVFERLISSNFKQKISYMNLKGTVLHITYQIPLRQHSCSVSFSFDINRPEKGITLTGKAFGAEEHDRWVQMAAYGAFLGNTGKAFIPQGFPPQINYKNPKGCTITLHFPQKEQKKSEDRRNKNDVLSCMSYVMKDLSMNYFIDVESAVKDLERKLPESDWNAVDQAFFWQAPYLGTALMERFQKKENFNLLYKVCQGSFDALLKYGLDDYENQPEIPEEMLEGYFNDPAYKDVPGNNGEVTKSLKLAATLFLLKGLKENRELAFPVVNELIENPEMRLHFPETVAALKSEFYRK